MRLVFTNHAKEQMVARGIDEQQVIDCILRGSKTRQTDGLLSSFGNIQVAYNVQGEKYIIKTVMLR